MCLAVAIIGQLSLNQSIWSRWTQVDAWKWRHTLASLADRRQKDAHPSTWLVNCLPLCILPINHSAWKRPRHPLGEYIASGNQKEAHGRQPHKPQGQGTLLSRMLDCDIYGSSALLFTASTTNAARRQPLRIMAAVSEPASPPAAKRARLDPDTQFSTLPPSPSNGHSESNGATSSTAHMPPVTSAPEMPIEPTRENEDYESDDEDVPEQPVAEEEDLSRADMYLDTVRLEYALLMMGLMGRYRGPSWISTLSGFVPRVSAISMFMLVWCVGNISREEEEVVGHIGMLSGTITEYG